MARTVVVAPGKLAEVLRADLKGRTRGVRLALTRAARMGRELLQSATPVDQETMIRAWKVSVQADGSVVITNDAPHAGIIERGARPHPVGQKVVELLREWTLRHGATEEESYGFAWAIAKKIEREGSKAHWILRDSKEELMRILHDELEAAGR